MKFDVEEIHEETDAADSAWAVCVIARLFLVAVAVWAAIYFGYLLWLEIF